MEIKAEVQIQSVTVYPDRARVTMTGRINIDKGTHLVHVDPLPLSLEAESVRAGGRGSSQVRLLGVDVKRSFFEQAPDDQVLELQQAIEAIQDNSNSLDDEIALLKAHSDYLNGLRQSTAEYAWGLSRGRTTIEQQTLLIQFLQDQEREQQTRGRELAKQKRELKRLLKKNQRELNLLQSKSQTQRCQALIEIEAQTDGFYDLSLTYVVKNAGWQPLYDVRLLSQESGSKLEITAIAQVIQRTGQDWQNVALTVSTARPALSQRLPDLDPWYVDVYKPPVTGPVRTRSGRQEEMVEIGAAQALASKMVATRADSESSYDVQEAIAEATESGTTLTYAVEGDVNIPSDGSPHKTIITRFTLDPELDYLSVPKHTDAVYRRVTGKNNGPGPMLAGKASLFSDVEYIGSTRFDYVPVGGEIEMLLGVEERITIDRELVRREVDKARMRDIKQMRYGYKLEIHNLLSDNINIELRDHIPVSRNEDIKIKLISIEPKPDDRSDLNIFEWKLQLAAGDKKELRYDFQIKYPRSQKVVGLID